MDAAGESVPHAHAAQAIWNPSAAANWSMPFSPIFGSYLHMLNWEVLGEPERAADSRRWTYASIAMLAGYTVAGMMFPQGEAASLAIRGAIIAYLLVWYFASAKVQMRYVKEKFGDDYPRKPWGRALLYAVAALLGYIALQFIVGVAAGLLGAFS
jgi:hypothetical protein